MKIGFFADDGSASHVAFLADRAFDRHDDTVPNGPTCLAGGECIVGVVEEYLDAASERGADLFVALPLACVDNFAIRSRLDLAVVTSGHQPLAVAGARRAWAAELATPRRGVCPVWMLPCRRELHPDAARTLPVRIDLRHGARHHRSGRLVGAAAQQAFGLAAALLLVAEDPHSCFLYPEDVLHVLEGRTTAAGLVLRDKLLGLAASFAGEPDEIVAAPGRKRRTAWTTVPTLSPGPRGPRRLARRKSRATPVRAATPQETLPALRHTPQA